MLTIPNFDRYFEFIYYVTIWIKYLDSKHCTCVFLPALYSTNKILIF